MPFDRCFFKNLLAVLTDRGIAPKWNLGTEKHFIRKSGMIYHVDLHAIVDGKVSVEKVHWIAMVQIIYGKKFPAQVMYSPVLGRMNTLIN